MLAVALSLKAAAGQETWPSRATPEFHWPETLADIQNADKLPVADLEAFLQKVSPVGHPPGIGESRLGDRGICLAATVGAANMKRYFSIDIVCPDPRAPSFQWTQLQGDYSQSLGDQMLDLDADGTFEIITRELAGGYRGGRSLPIYWYTIYRVKNGVPRDVSANYKGFYAARLLPWLDFFSHLLASNGSIPGDLATEVQVETRFVRAKYDRRIMGKPKAGFEDAVEWSKSSDRDLQLLAVWTFGDIAGADATEELRKLEKAKNSAVSGVAAFVLQNRTVPRQ
jgi:hypothetical protein